jgi:hypothetical protein
MQPGTLARFYNGFYIDTPVGNNAFSFGLRTSRRIYVPPLAEGTFADLRPGKETVFGEVAEDGKTLEATGLERFVYWRRRGVLAGHPDGAQHIFYFDNHNHAFFFWGAARQAGVSKDGAVLVHVDQHKDTRDPGNSLAGWDTPDGWPQITAAPDQSALGRVFYAANYVLNVGNFIPPALRLGWFDRVIQVGSGESFMLHPPENFVLDIDLDIFAPVMDYIPEELKISRLREWLGRAHCVTVATSPFFMDQSRALDIIARLFRD